MSTKISTKFRIIKPSSIISFFKLLCALPATFFVKRKNIWLVSEREHEARDNGYVFFKYAIANQDGIEVYYAINKKAKDFEKLKSHKGNVIQYGSIKHWIYYLSCKANISTVKNMGPDDLIHFIFRKINYMNDKMFFLQHGITKDDSKWLYYSNTKFRLFCCLALKEYEYIKERFGYPNDNIAYTGQCRFDLLDESRNTKDPFILIMPTHREWLHPGDPRMMQIEHTLQFEKTNYFLKWNELLNVPNLANALENTNLKLIFFPHPSMQKYVDNFNVSSDKIIIADSENWDLQKLVKEASMVITDYSSIAFDFIYMKKPVIYYQFDKEAYRQNQYAKGYFSYEDTNFGKSLTNTESVINEMQRYIENSFTVSEDYLKEREQYFTMTDKQNCKRTFDEIKKRVKTS